MKFIWSLVLMPAVALYLALPPPPLPDAAISHLRRGNFFWFKSSTSGKALRVFYIDTRGDGPENRTAVLLHGFPIGSMDWNLMLPGLRQLYGRIVAPEQLGYGFSDKPAFHHYTMAEQAEVVESLLEHLNVRAAHFLSHDTGAVVGQQIVLRVNRRNSEENNGSSSSLQLLSFTSINGPLYLRLDNQLALQYVIHLPVIGYSLTLFGFEAFYQFNHRAMFGERGVSDDTNSLCYAMLRHNDGHLAQHKIFHYMKEREWYEREWIAAQNRSSFPVMYIFGPADFFHLRTGFEQFQKDVPNARVAELASHIGHTPLWEDANSTLTAHHTLLKSVGVL